MIYAGANAIKNHESKLNNRRQMLMNRWVQATRKGDAAAAESAMTDIVNFSKKQPDFGISNKSLRTAYKNRLKAQERTIDGVYLPATKEDIRKIGRFTNPG